jgi:hypothetical protein
MKTRPTWTRYGRGVVMMGNYPPTKPAGEGEEQASIKPKNKPVKKD